MPISEPPHRFSRPLFRLRHRRFRKFSGSLLVPLFLGCTAASPPEDNRQQDSESLRLALERDLRLECSTADACGASLALLGNGCPYAVAYVLDKTDTSALRGRLQTIAEQSRLEFEAATEPQAVCDALPLRGAVCREGLCRPDFGFPEGP